MFWAEEVLSGCKGRDFRLSGEGQREVIKG